MADYLEEVEGDDPPLSEFAVLDRQSGSDQSDQSTEACGCDHPAPPDAPAIAEIDQSMSDQADQRTGNRAEDRCHKGQQTILCGNVCIRYRTWDRNEPSQHKEQRNTSHAERAAHAEDEIQLSDALALNPGVHASLFNTQGKSYWALEPRMSAKWAFAQGWSTKAAYSRMSQYVHLLSSSQMSLPIDLWVPITRNIAPEVSSQYSLGLYYGGIRGWEFSLEAYFKDMDNVVEYKDGVSFFLNSVGWENKVETGRGRAMGIELFVEKTMGKTTGWLGYTLSKSDRIFPTINAGKSFPFRYDRRHNINLVLNHRFSKKFDMSTTWTYASGGVTTLGERTVAMSSPTGEVYEAEHVPSRNNFRLPASHTLNLGFNLHKPHYRGESVWNLSIYNAYNHMNPNFVVKDTDSFFRGDEYVMRAKLVKLTILPIFPSIGYTRSF